MFPERRLYQLNRHVKCSNHLVTKWLRLDLNHQVLSPLTERFSRSIKSYANSSAVEDTQPWVRLWLLPVLTRKILFGKAMYCLMMMDTLDLLDPHLHRTFYLSCECIFYTWIHCIGHLSPARTCRLSQMRYLISLKLGVWEIQSNSF